MLLVSEVFPPQTGGSGRWFWEIYRRRSTNETMILAGATPDDSQFDQAQVSRIQRFPMSYKSWGLLSLRGIQNYRGLVRSIKQAVRESGAEQIHCGKVLPEGFAAWCLRRSKRIPYIVYVHGEELNIAAQSRELGWMTKTALGGAERVIANSTNTAELLTGDWGVTENQLRVLNPGVDQDRFQPGSCARSSDVRSRLGWNERRVILTVGRLQKRKGQDQLIRAVARLRDAFPNLLYSIVGDGPERGALETQIRDARLDAVVELRGEVSDEEMVDCYRECELFALPNRTIDGDFEGFGMVLLEAQACGRPVVAGKSGGTREAMQDSRTGRLADCDSIDELTGVIGELLDDPSGANEMGRRGRDWVVENFSWDSLAKKADAVFSEISARI